MQIKKEIFICYLLVILALVIIVAADQPKQQKASAPCSKCTKNPAKKSSPVPLNFISEGVFRYKA